jgi:type II secretory pathway pseudopilin PulG
MELLVVVAILGVLAAVAVPNVGKFIGKGKTEAYETELHNIQTAVMAMLADSTSGNLTVVGTNVTDMHLIEAENTAYSPTTLYLSDYMTGLTGTSVKIAGVNYTFLADGKVTQNHP